MARLIASRHCHIDEETAVLEPINRVSERLKPLICHHKGGAHSAELSSKLANVTMPLIAVISLANGWPEWSQGGIVTLIAGLRPLLPFVRQVDAQNQLFRLPFPT